MKGHKSSGSNSSFFAYAFGLLKQTGQEFLKDKAPQLGAALAYYTVFSPAPLILVLLAIVGIIFRHDPAGVWNKITRQMSYFLDASAVQIVQNIARQASQPGKASAITVQSVLPGGFMVAMTVYLVFDFAVIVLLFAMIFRFLPDAKIHWRDVWIGAVMTAILFGVGKWLLGLYLGSGAAGSAYGPASSLITLLLWVITGHKSCYSALSLLKCLPIDQAAK
jgi:uncharacterized BrkB/YihY/UPF0761 family membrane protein